MSRFGFDDQISVDHFCQGVADLFADILYSGEEENGLGDDETEEEIDEGWEREGKLEGRLRGLGESQWGAEMEWGGRGEARGERLPRSESSSPHKLHPARCHLLFSHLFFDPGFMSRVGNVLQTNTISIGLTF